MCPSLEDQDVLPGPLAVRKRAHSLRALVIEAGKELVEVFRAEGFEEPFAAVVVSQSSLFHCLRRSEMRAAECTVTGRGERPLVERGGRSSRTAMQTHT